MMRIVHIMKDGTVKDSIAGTVIRNEEFYQVLQGIVNELSNQRVMQKG